MEPTLHPNLARLAAAYDHILERYGRNEINASQARAEILELEARDDQGVRWSIDPDSGEWTRRTALGGATADAPPSWGYQTPDAFSFSADAPSAFNPGDRITAHAVDEELLYAPAGLAGASRAAQPDPEPERGGWRAALARTPLRTKVVAVVLALLAGFVVTHLDSGGSTPAPAPASTAPAPAH